MTSGDRERYSRQILFSQIGAQGQQRLLDSHAVIVGCGALGTLEAMALAGAGVGRLSIIDRDYVDASNLQRQFLFEESDAAEALPKAAAAERRLRRLNSTIEIRGIIADLNPSNAEELLDGAGVVLDGTDNFETRYLINDYSVSRGVPWIYGAAVGSYGLTMPVIPGRTACLRCIYPEPPGGAQPTCDTSGVLNAVTGAVASLEVADAIKILSGRPDCVVPRITTIDVWSGEIRQTAQPPEDPDCPTCARRDFVPQGRRERAGEYVRAERGADPRRSPPHRPGSTEIAPRRNRRGPRQRVRAAIHGPAFRDDYFPRRPRHHQGHNRPGHRARAVCAVCGELTGTTWHRHSYLCFFVGDKRTGRNAVPRGDN